MSGGTLYSELDIIINNTNNIFVDEFSEIKTTNNTFIKK